MTVSELIEKLKTMPPDAPVIYCYQSDYDALEPDQVELIAADEKKVVRRGGRFCYAYPSSEYPPGESPEYITVCRFPGN